MDQEIIDDGLNQTTGDLTATPEETTLPTPETPAQEFQFEWKNRPIKVPYTDPRLKQWVSQGYDYAQNMGKFNQERQALTTKVQEYETKYSKIDEWAKTNPDKWQSLYTQWEQASAPQQQQMAATLPPEITEKLAKLDEILSERETTKLQSEDQALEGQIKSIQGKYPNLDLNTLQDNGKTLEFNVLEFAHKNKIGDFGIAFKAFNHEQLMKLAEDKAKETLAKDAQKKTKLGLLGSTQAPTKQGQGIQNVRNKTYEQILDEVLSNEGA